MAPSNNNIKKLAKDALASYNDRIRVIETIVEDTHSQTKHFRKQRETASQELKEKLARGEYLRRKDFDQMTADIISRQHEREEEVRKMLERFRNEEEAIAGRFKNLLEKKGTVRIKDFKKVVCDIKQGQAEKAREAGGLVAAELKKMHQEISIMLDTVKNGMALPAP